MSTSVKRSNLPFPSTHLLKIDRRQQMFYRKRESLSKSVPVSFLRSFCILTLKKPILNRGGAHDVTHHPPSDLNYWRLQQGHILWTHTVTQCFSLQTGVTNRRAAVFLQTQEDKKSCSLSSLSFEWYAQVSWLVLPRLCGWDWCVFNSNWQHKCLNRAWKTLRGGEEKWKVALITFKT